MPIDATDFRELVALVDAHPEWKAELRRLVLTDDLLAVPERMRSLEDRVDALTAQVAELGERVAVLVDGQRALGHSLQQLAEAQRRTEASLEGLAERLGLLADRQSAMRGDILETRYPRRASAIFGPRLRRLRVVLPGALDAESEDLLEPRLAPEAFFEVLRLDLLVRGRRRDRDAELWVAAEVSALIDQNDVERAERRAALLREAGFPTVAAVAGDAVTAGATARLQDRPVILVLDGRQEGWDEALRDVDARAA